MKIGYLVGSYYEYVYVKQQLIIVRACFFLSLFFFVFWAVVGWQAYVVDILFTVVCRMSCWVGLKDILVVYVV